MENARRPGRQGHLRRNQLPEIALRLRTPAGPPPHRVIEIPGGDLTGPLRRKAGAALRPADLAALLDLRKLLADRGDAEGAGRLILSDEELTEAAIWLAAGPRSCGYAATDLPVWSGLAEGASSVARPPAAASAEVALPPRPGRAAGDTRVRISIRCWSTTPRTSLAPDGPRTGAEDVTTELRRAGPRPGAPRVILTLRSNCSHILGGRGVPSRG